MPALDLIRFNPSGAFVPQHGITAEEMQALAPQLEAARREVVETDVEQFTRGNIPAEKQPLDAGFYLLPERLLAEYKQHRGQSEVGRIMGAARRMQAKVDRVVVLGIGGSYMGARALMEACCQPYYNELSRADRAGYPRIYFEGNNVDNDASQGLLHLLGNGRPATTINDRWGIVVISKSGGTLETAAAFRQFLAALQKSCGGDAKQVAELIVPVTGNSGKLFDLAKALGCADVFPVPDGVGGRFSVLSAVGLLPAAMMGLDILRLLEGAAAMNEHFRTAPPGQNVVLDYVAAAHLLEKKRGVNLRVMSVWAKGLEAAGLWYDQLLAESLGKHERGATPFTAVNTRDLHSRAQQHQEGARDKVMTNVIVDRWRFDSLPIGRSEHDQDKLNELAAKTLPEVMTAAIQGTNQAYREDNRPTLDFNLPSTAVGVLGQFFQMLMLSTAVEGRLMGINPYGQPGVEKYKINMNRILREGK